MLKSRILCVALLSCLSLPAFATNVALETGEGVVRVGDLRESLSQPEQPAFGESTPVTIAVKVAFDYAAVCSDGDVEVVHTSTVKQLYIVPRYSRGVWDGYDTTGVISTVDVGEIPVTREPCDGGTIIRVKKVRGSDAGNGVYATIFGVERKVPHVRVKR